jgi:hypothetical protein
MSDFSGSLLAERGKRQPVNRYAQGDYVQARLGELTWDAHALALVAEVRRLADGRVFLGVRVNGPGGTYSGGQDNVILSWNNCDPERWVLPAGGDPASHEVTVVEDLCSALEALAVDEHDAAYDALAAGRLLLSSAAYQRARALRDAVPGDGEVQS